MRGKKDNCCYYDSKLITEEKENHSINRRVKEKFINYPNENKNTSNTQSYNISKRIIFDSNIGKRNEICNSGTKKHESE